MQGVFMKKFHLVLGRQFMALLALALVFGLAFVSCDNGSGSGNNGGVDNPGNGNTPGGDNPGNGDGTARFQGTYISSGGFVPGSITFTGNNFSLLLGDRPVATGTFTVSVNTMSLLVVTSTFISEQPGDVILLSIINDNSLYLAKEDMTFTKSS
jgi:hypothetical protein